MMQALAREEPGCSTGLKAKTMNVTAIIPLVPVVEAYVGIRLRRQGREYVGRCPFHPDRRPSFSVNDSKGVFHCFGCGASGNAITFVARLLGISNREARRRLVDDGFAEPAVSRELVVEQELRRRLDDMCFKAACDVAEWARVLDGRSYGERLALARYLHLLPCLDDLRERLLSDDLETRLAALKEARPWLLS